MNAASASPANDGASRERPGTDHLSAEEAAAVLRQVLAGERSVQALPQARPLISVAVGEWTARSGDAEMVFFIENASLAHLAAMSMADGRQGSFGEWLMRDGANPLELIEEDDRIALEQRLREAG